MTRSQQRRVRVGAVEAAEAGARVLAATQRAKVKVAARGVAPPRSAARRARPPAARAPRPARAQPIPEPANSVAGREKRARPAGLSRARASQQARMAKPARKLKTVRSTAKSRSTARPQPARRAGAEGDA